MMGYHIGFEKLITIVVELILDFSSNGHRVNLEFKIYKQTD